jgi:hypothetical protein
LFSDQAKTILEQDSELGLGHAPFPRWHFPLLCCQVQHQEQELQGTVVGGKVASGSGCPAQLGVQAFNSICCINNPTNIVMKSEERDYL